LFFRDKPAQFKAPIRYRTTLDLSKIRPGRSEEEVFDYLTRIGFSRTSNPIVWKCWDNQLPRLPSEAILKAEKL
jgi:hypothetical protein